VNTVSISGYVAGDSELRALNGDRELLNFDVSVDGPKGRDPIVHVAYFPRGNGDVRKIEAGRRVFVEGSLRHRVDTRLFIAARTVRVLDAVTNVKDSSPEASLAAQ
jgi:hypothetical protein